MQYNVRCLVDVNDFNRYIYHGNLFDTLDLEKASVILKNDLKQFMLVKLANLTGSIEIQIFKDDDYQVYVVFDMDKQDVYYKCRHTVITDYWQSLLMFGENNSNHLDRLDVDNEWFAINVNKAVKYLMVYHYPTLKKFITDNMDKLVETRKFKDDLVKMFVEQYETPQETQVTETTEEQPQEVQEEQSTEEE